MECHRIQDQCPNDYGIFQGTLAGQNARLTGKPLNLAALLVPSHLCGMGNLVRFVRQ